MNDLITVEDWNSAILTYPNPFEYELDTKGLNLNQEYTYDFIKVKITNETIDGENGFKYDFKFYNDLFLGKYYLLKENGELTEALVEEYSIHNNQHHLELYSLESNVKLNLVLNTNSESAGIEKIGCIVTLENNLFLNNFTKRTYQFNIKNYDSRRMKSFNLKLKTIDNETITLSPTATEGSTHFKTKVIFEYTPGKLLKDELEFTIVRGEEVVGGNG